MSTTTPAAAPVTDYATEFAGRTALVTGAASGIGLATARRLGAGGANVVAAAVAAVEGGSPSSASAAPRCPSASACCPSRCRSAPRTGAAAAN
jgi:NAD(P)-dependent dehydrogenase (short-subunit alcohol dehydrogenase family)